MKKLARAFSIVLTVATSIPLSAQVSADQVISDVSKLVERGVSDKKIAHQIAELRPTYYLSERSIEELAQKQAIGPRTLFELHVLAYKSLYLDPSPTEDRPADPPPDPASAEKLEQSIRSQMTQSLDLLPKFICKKQETMFLNCRGGFPAKTRPVCDEEWYQIEPYHFGHESPMANDRVPIGNFKIVLDSSLQWKRWDLCSGQKCAVFSYSEKSVPHARGLVFCSPSDGTIYQITTTLPFRHEGISNGITDFGPVLIDNSTYRFPIRFVNMIHNENRVNWLRGIVVVSDYHKLKADSNILYGPPK